MLSGDLRNIFDGDSADAPETTMGIARLIARATGTAGAIDVLLDAADTYRNHVADMDDENVQPSPTFMVFHPAEQEFGAGRLLVHTKNDPYALVPPLTRTIRELERDQPVERASTLEDVRAEVLAPTKLNTIVFGGFAAVALAIAVVGVAGVLAFSVSGRIREFGVRLAM